MRTATALAARGAAILMLGTAGVTFGTTPAQAWDCAPGTPAQNVARADGVFVGTTTQEADDNVFNVRVSDIYKGSPSAWIVVDGGDWRSMNGFQLLPHQQFVFYGSYDGQANRWSVRACEGTTVVSDNALATVESELGSATPLRGVSGPPPSTEQSGNDDGASDDPSTGDDNPQATAASDEPAATDDGSPWPWVGGGAIVVAVVGAGIVARRRSSAG